jgi:hypothetical protein
MVRDVLDLVRDRPGVDLPKPWQGLEERLARDGQPEQPSGNARLQLVGERRLQTRLVERGVPHRLRAERIEAGVEVPVRAIRLDERHCGRDAPQELVVERRCDRSCALGRGFRRSCPSSSRLAIRDDRCAVSVSLHPACVDDAVESRWSGHGARVATLEELAPGGIDRLGVVQVLLEKLADVSGVEPGGGQRRHGLRGQ